MSRNSIPFTKMHGLGNDFVVINSLVNKYDLSPAFIAELANRHTGIGFDQLLLIEPSHQANIFCRIFNADGSEAEQCGNGLRCIARYIHEEGLDVSKQLSIETRAGLFTVEISDYDHIRVCMGQPVITQPQLELRLASKTASVCILSLGNPHAVMQVNDLNDASLEQLAKEIAADKHFPDGVNVGFMQVAGAQHIRLRTFERGSGETYACGSNACATAVAGILQNVSQSPVKVDFRYGSLTIEWEGKQQPVYMTGAAARVYSGEVK
jgi:diaminopimelate epimerase